MAAITPWRQLLLESIQANKHLKHSEYFQLATVRENGKPANRTVVFRGLIEGTEKLQFTTDARSHKIEEIKAQAFGEICWYFTDTREQFRISGTLDVIGEADRNAVRLKMRERAWFQSSPNSRLQFVGPSPGFPCPEGGPNDSTTPQLDPAQGPVENFCLVTLEPQEVDYLNLRKNKRYVFQKMGEFSWTQREVNP
ncbi:pyridoxamine 5'-phosphate oxidase [Marchantia polymorpha subsp. ruderalis]|uniref:pyridoxal 5'-phosphate synthase n=2 Tax=Marchantia polymorpha TaxID=3197 RepID=A0AAF6AZ18_MARPO|nr:hypothetical protein MARPO_0085s0082 [Marchantia polymorpha]BBN05002.1 hypothetical protein Mp_3g09450 [Marchantia polymorpha subsp. ruderalis]|eukprot:PTQ33874.1 hypothetical protein MARPO_0085s0082 [Marchantia polymorpha]